MNGYQSHTVQCSLSIKFWMFSANLWVRGSSMRKWSTQILSFLKYTSNPRVHQLIRPQQAWWYSFVREKPVANIYWRKLTVLPFNQNINIGKREEKMTRFCVPIYQFVVMIYRLKTPGKVYVKFAFYWICFTAIPHKHFFWNHFNATFEFFCCLFLTQYFFLNFFVSILSFYINWHDFFEISFLTLFLPSALSPSRSASGTSAPRSLSTASQWMLRPGHVAPRDQPRLIFLVFE